MRIPLASDQTLTTPGPAAADARRSAGRSGLRGRSASGNDEPERGAS
jgi:hypothetical protein